MDYHLLVVYGARGELHGVPSPDVDRLSDGIGVQFPVPCRHGVARIYLDMEAAQELRDKLTLALESDEGSMSSGEFLDIRRR